MGGRVAACATGRTCGRRRFPWRVPGNTSPSPHLAPARLLSGSSSLPPVGRLPLGDLVLITPQGYWVMGLEADSLVSLLRALG